MLGRLRHRLTYANLMATMAVFIALGGTSYAAITITSKNVKNNSLTSADVKNRSLLSQDFKAGQLPAGATGPHGPAGPQGPKGDAGTQGEKGEKGAQGEPATRLFAHVKNDGALNYGSGVSATRRVGTGVYSVTFNRSVTQCSPVFTSGWGRPTGSDFNAGPLDAWFYMPSDTEIWVYSYNNSGTTTNGSFHIALFC